MNYNHHLLNYKVSSELEMVVQFRKKIADINLQQITKNNHSHTKDSIHVNTTQLSGKDPKLPKTMKKPT